MGPRLVERGKKLARFVSLVRKGFNGAALGRARKVAPLRLKAVEREMLQWGRAWLSAERRVAVGHVSGFLPLQWGRAWLSAERTFCINP